MSSRFAKMILDPPRPGEPSPYQDVRAFEPHMGNLPLTDEQLQEGYPRVVTLDELPIQDVSADVPLEGDQTSLVCMIRMTASQALTALARVCSPMEASFASSGGAPVGGFTDANNPFNTTTIPAGSTLVLPANIAQQIEVLGIAICGHQDLMVEIPFNMPLNRIVRLSQFGSSMIVKARVIARYTPSITVGNTVSWLIGPTGSSFDRNEAFNNPPPVSRNATFARALMLQGFVGKGFTSPVPPMRIFNAWVEPLAIQNTQHICPIARGAETVFLGSDGSNANNDAAGSTAPFQGVRLMFNQICLSPGATTTRRVLNQPANVTVPLRSDCIAIEVVNIDVPPAATGVPFELQYDVGF